MSKYTVDYEIYPGFLSQMKKYNDKYKHLKNFKELKKEVILALQTSPRKYVPLNAHPLHLLFYHSKLLMQGIFHLAFYIHFLC